MTLPYDTFDEGGLARSWNSVYSFTGTLSPSTGSSRLYNDTDRTLHIAVVRASVGTAPTGSAIVVDIKKNGTTIYTTTGNRPTIPAASNTVVAALPNDITINPNDYLTVDIISVGSSTAGSDLTVQVSAS